MDNEKSTAPGRSSAIAKTEQAPTHSEGAVGRRGINMPMIQNVLLIWLDGNIDDHNTDCCNTITQMRCAINTINTFTDGEECIQFLKDMQNEKACMVISGALGLDILPRVHDLSQVDSIFIFCSRKEYHEQWAKEWSKIKGVFTEIEPICEGLKKAAHQCEQDAISFSFVATNGDISQKNLDQLDPSFICIQILKEIVLTINFEQQHIKEFIEYCRHVLADNKYGLVNVKKLEQKYRDKTPIWWYTYECFLYPMLNRALRLMDVDITMKMGFFIADLYRHIEQLHKKQFGSQKSSASFTVYRGQGLSKTDFQQLTKTKGGLISFNNFLFTSRDRNVSLDFAHRASLNPDMAGILFVITIDPAKSTTPFASTIDVGYHGDKEDKILFAIHTVFRISDIKPMEDNYRLFQVELTLTNDDDKDLRILTDHIRKNSFPEIEGWCRLSSVLFKLGQVAKAQQVYDILLKRATTENEKAPIYYQLGLAKHSQGEYKEAFTYYEKSLEIDEKTLPPNHSNLAASYDNIGNVYKEIGEYSKALSYYEKALAIRESSLPSSHPDLGKSYNNIGWVYENIGEYSKALSFHEKALEIRKQSLSPSHPDLAVSYNNIGNVYYNMEEYQKAISSYEKALRIKQQLLPSNHPDLGMSYNNIGLAFNSMGEYQKALSYHEKALEIKKQSIPSNHPDLAACYNNFGLVYENMNNYSKACSFYERAVDIAQRSLPSDHPNLQKWREHLETIKKKL